jgi:fumarate reductase flavoprotein subunit
MMIQLMTRHRMAWGCPRIAALAILASLVVFAGCATKRGAEIAGGASGTAEATAQGYYGPVTVSLTVESGKIVAVSAQGPDETPGIGSRALTAIPAQMLEQNSLAVDVVSGATVTSRAVIQAAQEAEAQIRN